MSDAEDRFAIIARLDHYAECLDTRDWEGLSGVFTNDVEWTAIGAALASLF